MMMMMMMTAAGTPGRLETRYRVQSAECRSGAGGRIGIGGSVLCSAVQSGSVGVGSSRRLGRRQGCHETRRHERSKKER
jgi:hypothetical protein